MRRAEQGEAERYEQVESVWVGSRRELLNFSVVSVFGSFARVEHDGREGRSVLEDKVRNA